MIGRRTFLKWGSAAPLLLSHSPIASAAGILQNTLLVIDDLGITTDPQRTAIVLDAFARKGLPVTCLLDPKQGQLQPNSALSHVLREPAESTPGLLQIVPLVAQLGTMTPYFQARAAYEARRALLTSIWRNEDRQPANIATSQTLACDMLPVSTAPAGVRASRIRNVLMRPHVSAQVRPEAWDNGVVRMIGGQRIRLQSPQTAYSFPKNPNVEQVYYLSAQDFSQLPLAGLEASASAFAAQILQPRGDHWPSAILASDMQFRDAYAYRRYVGVHFILKPDSTAHDQEVLKSFRQELANEGLPSSHGVDASVGSSPHYWINLKGQASNNPSKTQAPLMDASSPSRRTNAVGGYGQAIELTGKHEAGLSARNTLKLSTVEIQNVKTVEETLQASMGAADSVLSIPAGILQSKAHQKVLKNALHRIRDDGISQVISLPDYARHVVPTDAYTTHFRRTEAYRPQIAKPPQVPSVKERRLLMEDAKVAWSYFEQWTNPKTGLCPATANFSASHLRLHETVTMWDVGSHIFALMAAADLELITAQTFQRAIRKLLPNIAGRRSQGRLLPQGWIATNKRKWGNRNFDGCDAGRLLAALYNLDTHPLAKGLATSTVTSWDLEHIVKDGVIHSVEEGVLTSTFRSHCAHYAAWAFRTWGIEAQSPYEVFQEKSSSDGQMTLLEVCGHIGPMGAEPLLMEALEFGMSPESAYLADVLFAAQLEEYEETGRLICVSEGPINSTPWFLYQGLQFDALGRVWATDTVAGLEEHRSEAFRDEHLSVSSKAAYLWSAYKDHPLSDKLLSFVREKARTPYGFASSINEKTGEPSRTYSDINTNAVILQSIAARLKQEG